MSANPSSTHKSVSLADRLKRKLAKIKAAEREKFFNENIVRLEKNGDLSHEAVRTYTLPQPKGEAIAAGRHEPRAEPYKPEAQATGTDAQRWSPAADNVNNSDGAHSGDRLQNPAISNLLPNKLPQTPALQENGNLIADSAPDTMPPGGAPAGTQIDVAVDLAPIDATVAIDHDSPANAGISCHEGQNSGNDLRGAGLSPGVQDPPSNEHSADPLEELVHRALVATKTRRGRPRSLDDQAKGQLVALLSVGMSIRQAAAILGVSHTTVQKTLKADPALGEDITAARFQAQLQPLACVIREARRSWKAATWLLKYLDSKIASHEETPDERRQRQQRETEEFLTRAHGTDVKTRHILG